SITFDTIRTDAALFAAALAAKLEPLGIRVEQVSPTRLVTWEGSSPVAAGDATARRALLLIDCEPAPDGSLARVSFSAPPAAEPDPGAGTRPARRLDRAAIQHIEAELEAIFEVAATMDADRASPR